MSHDMSNEKIMDLFNKARKKFDQAEIFQLETNSKSAGIRNGQLKEMEEDQNKGLCLRVIHSKKIAQTSTSDYERLDHLLDQASELVKFGENAVFDFPEPGHFEPQDTVESDTQIDELVEEARVIVNNIHEYDQSANTQASASHEMTRIRVMNSSGVDVEFERSGFATFGGAVLTEGKNILHTYGFHISQERCPDPAAISQDIITKLQMARKNVSFESQTLPIMLTPAAFADVLAALSSGFSGSMVARKMSPLCDKLGSLVLHPEISIMDDPMYSKAASSQPFDDEGVSSQKKYIIRDGVLENYAVDLKSAAMLKIPPKGNGYRFTSLIQSRSYSVSPSPHLTNLIISAGKRTHNEIIKSLPKMLYIDQLTGVLLGNLINGDWSGNIEYGVLFEHGEPVGRVKNAMTGGNLYSMFKSNFSECSSDRKWAAGFGSGAGTSLLPYIVFDGINISAKSNN